MISGVLFLFGYWIVWFVGSFLDLKLMIFGGLFILWVVMYIVVFVMLYVGCSVVVVKLKWLNCLVNCLRVVGCICLLLLRMVCMLVRLSLFMLLFDVLCIVNLKVKFGFVEIV